MGTPRARLLARIAVAAVVLLAPTTTCGVAGHSRALRPGGGRGQQQPSSLFPANATRAEAIERQFVEWVRYVGGLRHSTFQHAVARASPSYSLVVDKDPALGDFTTIQAAVDSLPAINLVRVVIRVNAGTYTEKVTVSAMRAFITLEGAGADKTVVQWGDTADSPTGPKGRPLGTFNSASFAVNAQYFLARNITFKDCHVHAIARDYGALTAQNRQSMLEDTGFSFVNCRVTGSGALYLGRAWGTFSRVVFAYTHMDDIIVPNGWFNWGDPNRELTVFYGQYKCTGPGATYAGRVAWSHELTDDEAKPFISLSFIDGTEWVRL
ncbi:Pectinesterase [Zea mays]|uniref:pectinesterase n=1 Tax=Zea mays TaxID=4577 RepID=A0A1D6NCW6_MAIZE|nr:Pectinesterase [Zea mays]